ncbi:MAG: alpha-keto acid decarboxylase family protein [Gammaproteobacteria bacterium]|jgi:TPP-dependent 2-oxoacid decarboxylase|nr:alpha-keto acid decarboxylase family protein [Gammaproteobacteria bacterium]
MTSKKQITVSDYILRRLKSQGVDHVFGIPGDFILPFFEVMADSDMEQIAACNEMNAGYAADGYARLKGLAAVAVTYGPGSFSLVNAVAGAFAERVPLLAISGGPRTETYKNQPALHHLLPEKYDASINIYKQITAHCALINDTQQAAAEIDKALTICLEQSRPVFLEIPVDIQLTMVDEPEPLVFDRENTKDDAALNDALQFIVKRIKKSKRTVILPGHEIHRAELQNKLIELLDKTGIHVGSMFIGKADYLEHLPCCIGAYQGAGSPKEVKEFVEEAETVVFLGTVPSDFNLGGFTAKLTEQQKIVIWNDKVKCDDISFENIPITTLLNKLVDELPDGEPDANAPVQQFSHRTAAEYIADADAVMTNKRFYDRMAGFFKKDDIVLADAGCAINSTHMQLPEGVDYVASCYWASIGMGFGATLGACMAANENQRVIALEGDGSFQMTAQELSTIARYGKSAIVFVVNNKGYTAERLIHDGPFNDIPAWNYHQLPAAFGGGDGIEVHTEGDLEMALERAETWQGPGPLLIEVHIDPWDASEAFKLMSEALRTK